MSSDISRFPKTVEDELHIIRTGRIELPLSPYQRDFLPLKDVREPVEIVETSSTAWKTVVIAITLYGHIVDFY